MREPSQGLQLPRSVSSEQNRAEEHWQDSYQLHKVNVHTWRGKYDFCRHCNVDQFADDHEVWAHEGWQVVKAILFHGLTPNTVENSRHCIVSIMIGPRSDHSPCHSLIKGRFQKLLLRYPSAKGPNFPQKMVRGPICLELPWQPFSCQPSSKNNNRWRCNPKSHCAPPHPYQRMTSILSAVLATVAKKYCLTFAKLILAHISWGL